MSGSNMYEEARTWNPFKGCDFDCVYCRPSFQKQAKRQMHLCGQCYSYVPHCHPSRLGRIPSAKIVFVAGNGDLAFCPPAFLNQILDSIERHNRRCPHKTYYLQSKAPACLEPVLHRLPQNVILVTTLETNRDEGYHLIARAPVPSERYLQFLNLVHPRKVVTIEPVMDFDLEVFASWIIKVEPEYVWLGLNSRPGQVQLPEPPAWKLRALVQTLSQAGVQVRFKEMRGVDNLR